MGEDFFVRVEDPDRVHLAILESSKLALHSMQSFYKISQIRNKKNDSVRRLKLRVKELNLLVNKLEGILPYNNVVVKSEKLSQSKPKSRSAKKPLVIEHAELKSGSNAELDRLNKALASIENKITSLSR